MPLDDIIRKIEEDARTEAESLLSVARAEADAIMQRAQKKVEELRSELKKQAEKKAAEHGERIRILAGLDRRKEALREKRKLVEEAFEKAEERIRNLSEDEQRAFLKPLILRAAETGNEEIIPSAGRREIFTADFLESLNRELGNHGRLRLSEEDGEFPAGFILREGKKEINQTLKSLIDSQRDTLEPLVADILFGNKKSG